MYPMIMDCHIVCLDSVYLEIGSIRGFWRQLRRTVLRFGMSLRFCGATVSALRDNATESAHMFWVIIASCDYAGKSCG